MQNSVLLAKIIGPYFIVMAIGVLCNLKFYQKIMEEFLKDIALVYMCGVFSLISGIVIVLFHNVWVVDWQVFITIFGWLALIKGAWLIVLPKSGNKLNHLYHKKAGLLTVHLVVILIVGVLLTVKGYFI